jgi:hypothetical protein
MTTTTKKQKAKLREKKILKELQSMEGGSFLNLVKSLGNKLSGCKGKNPALDYKPKSNPTEHHQVLKAPDGCFYRAQFSGPQTHVQEGIMGLLAKHENNISLALADKNFASKVDLAALAHDLRYLFATTPEEVTAADKKFVAVTAVLPDKINSRVPNLAISAKILAGNTQKGKEEIDPETLPLMEKVLEFAKMKGYGRPDRKIECEYCGSTAKNQALHQLSKSCINKKNKIFN